MVRLRRFVIGLVLVVSASALVAAASAAGGRYAGKVKNGGALSFQVSGSSVRLLHANVSVSCVSVAPARSGVDVYVLSPPGAAAITRGGRFSARFKARKQKLYAHGKLMDTLYSVDGTVAGSVRGRTAGGTVKVTYGKTWMAYNPGTGFYQLTSASCFARTSWSASQR